MPIVRFADMSRCLIAFSVKPWKGDGHQVEVCCKRATAKPRAQAQGRLIKKKRRALQGRNRFLCRPYRALEKTNPQTQGLRPNLYTQVGSSVRSAESAK
jgi:hypothetical protein